MEYPSKAVCPLRLALVNVCLDMCIMSQPAVLVNTIGLSKNAVEPKLDLLPPHKRKKKAFVTGAVLYVLVLKDITLA